MHDAPVIGAKQFPAQDTVSQGESDHITDTPSPRSDENTTAVTGETSETASCSGESETASTIDTTKGGWYQLDGVPEIREMIFKECLCELDGEILEMQNHCRNRLDSALLVSYLDVLHVCKDFVNEFAPPLRKSLALVTTTWEFESNWDEWEDALLQFANLKRLVAASKHYGFRFSHYWVQFKACDPGGYETAGFLAALAKYMRAEGAIGGHKFDGGFKAWWIDWRGISAVRGNIFYYEIEDRHPVYLDVMFEGTGTNSDTVVVNIRSDVATLGFQDFDWRPTEKGEYVPLE